MIHFFGVRRRSFLRCYSSANKTQLIDVVRVQSERLEKANVAFGQGTSEAFDEAAWIALRTLQLPVDSRLETITVSDSDVRKIEQTVEQRITKRLPTSYILKEAYLQDVAFYVDERAVIPRSLIAELIADRDEAGILDEYLTERTHRVLDLCTGNGSLGILAAMHFPTVSVVASDVSRAALEVARINVDRHRLGERVRLVESDLYAELPQTEPFELILCNPPYVTDANMRRLPPEFKAEPSIALAGGSDGMSVIRRILQQAPHYLTHDDSCLVLEVGRERAGFQRAFPRLSKLLRFLPTSAGDDQVLLLTKKDLIEQN